MKNTYFTEETRNEGWEVTGMSIDSNYQLKDVYDLPDAIDKLGELEKIERNIDCPLEVCINAQRYGFYGCSPFYDNEIKFFDTENNFIVIDFNLGRLQVDINRNPYDVITFYLSDYKKDWWLKADRSE